MGGMMDLEITPEVMLSEGPVDPGVVTEATRRFASDGRFGGIASFTGIVRADETGEGRVRAIEFTAYQEMAETGLRELINRVVDESLAAGSENAGPVRVHLEHALGEVAVGEAPVIIVVATGHREEAFAICRGILEALKQEIPIYGKELLEGEGYRWKKNR
ncbi:MAG: molybdenum cofactor biosynthesis protein MoaE [Spirochaetaceae bacterium]